MQNVMIQLMQQLGQDLPQPAVAQQSGNTFVFPQEFAREFQRDQDQFQTFTSQCKMFMACRLVEFPADHTKVNFVLSLLKEEAST